MFSAVSRAGAAAVSARCLRVGTVRSDPTRLLDTEGVPAALWVPVGGSSSVHARNMPGRHRRRSFLIRCPKNTSGTFLMY